MMIDFDSVSSVKLCDLDITNNLLTAYHPDPNLVLSGLSEKSHLVGKGFVFFALSGTTTHGAHFTKDAVSRGAGLVISDPEGEKIIQALDLRIPVYIFKKPREILAKASSSFFKAQPSCIAVSYTHLTLPTKRIV